MDQKAKTNQLTKTLPFRAIFKIKQASFQNLVFLLMALVMVLGLPKGVRNYRALRRMSVLKNCMQNLMEVTKN